MNTPAYIALTITALSFIGIAFRFARGVKSLPDFVPIAREGRARVRSTRNFSASTIATSISLATLISAYFGLASYFGLWLLWTALTSALGMYLVYRFSSKISKKLSAYPYVPSIHEFLSSEYSSPALRPVAATLTVVGLLLLLATELLVGSTFLGELLPGAPRWLLVVGLSAVPVLYVVIGGFETVVITDRIQMILIWIMIPAFFVALLTGGKVSAESLQNAQLLRPIDSGLIWFLLGIFLMNVPTALSSITVWQRVSASETDVIRKKGLFQSSIGIFISWALLVVIACLASIAGQSSSGIQACRTLLQSAASSALGSSLVFAMICGLYCALLSTASTFLIAIGHTFSTDILGWERHTIDAVPPKHQLKLTRITIVAATLGSCGIVALFEHFGFKIEDIIFSIYGGALALFPPMALALLRSRSELMRLSKHAFTAITVGFLSGWSAALSGKAASIQNLIFMSPAIGMFMSALVLAIGYFSHKEQKRPQPRRE